MEEYYYILQKNPLFKEADNSDIRSMLDCLDAKMVSIKKGEYVVIEGEAMKSIGIVLSGGLQVVKDDSEGIRTILAGIGPSDIFGEAVCCAGMEQSPVSVVANEVSDVLLLDFKRILNVCSNTCTFHLKLIENMLYVLAQKNLFLQNRMDITSKKRVREKILMYLDSLGAAVGKIVDVPLNREQMAEYLCVERSALSHELMRMKKDGIIDYHKNSFKLL